MVQVTAEVEGAVTEVRFHEGDSVNPKTLLARIDPDRYRLELEGARAALDQAIAELGRAQADLRRREELARNQLVAAEEMTRSQGENARLSAAVAVARAALGIAQQNFHKAEVRAPHAGSVADPTTRQVEVLAWVKNPGVLKPGFFAEVTLAGESRKEAIVVPEGAVQASEQGFVTYVVENGKARLRPIEIGLRTGTGVVEILSGVKAQEMVVIEGSDRLADGIDVQPVAASPVAAADKP